MSRCFAMLLTSSR